MLRIVSHALYLSHVTNSPDNATRDETPSSHWETVVKDIIWNELDDSLPRFRHNAWRQVFTETGQTLFEAPVQETSVDNNYFASRQQIWERLRTLSQFSVLEGEKLAVRPANLPMLVVLSGANRFGLYRM